MTFSIEKFISEAREAAQSSEPTRAIRRLLKKALENPGEIADANPLENDEKDVLLFEDDSVSVWITRFVPDIVIPPHEHKMNAFIGVFQGREKNIFFKRQSDGLKYTGSKVLATGQVLSIGGDGIHSVVADGNEPCCSLHVYTGPLSKTERSIFDWDSGSPIEFTDKNYESMKRSPRELDFMA